MKRAIFKAAFRMKYEKSRLDYKLSIRYYLFLENCMLELRTFLAYTARAAKASDFSGCHFVTLPTSVTCANYTRRYTYVLTGFYVKAHFYRFSVIPFRRSSASGHVGKL